MLNATDPAATVLVLVARAKSCSTTRRGPGGAGTDVGAARADTGWVVVEPPPELTVVFEPLEQAVRRMAMLVLTTTSRADFINRCTAGYRGGIAPIPTALFAVFMWYRRSLRVYAEAAERAYRRARLSLKARAGHGLAGRCR